MCQVVKVSAVNSRRHLLEHILKFLVPIYITTGCSVDIRCANSIFFFTDFEFLKLAQVIMQFQLPFESTSRYKKNVHSGSTVKTSIGIVY